MIDKKQIEELAKNLCFEEDKDQIEKVIQDIKGLDNDLKDINIDPNSIDAIPVDYPRVVNCASLRKDVPEQKEDKDYLSNAKVANKYMVGK